MNSLSLNLKVRKPFLYILILVLIISAYNLVIKKELAYIAEMKGNISRLNNELTIIENKVKSINDSQLKIMEQKAEKLKSQYDLGLESPLVLLDITKFASEVGIEIIEFSSQEKSDFQEFKQRKYDIALKGTYEQFINWLRLMEKMPYYVNIDSLKISKYFLTQEKRTNYKAVPQLVYRVTINNIALDGEVSYGGADPEYFRTDPFKPGI